MKLKSYNNDRGATFIVVLAVFTFITILALSIMVMATSADTGFSQEIDMEQNAFYVSSVYQVMNDRFVAGEFKNALVEGEVIEINVTGFTDSKGGTIPVKMQVERTNRRVLVTYLITHLGIEHEIIGDYSISGTNEDMLIVERGCYGLE